MKFNSAGGWGTKKNNPEDDDVDYDQLKEYVDECLIHLAIFNGWEESFLIDMQDLVGNRKPLTVRQREIIGNLHDKVVRRRR